MALVEPQPGIDLPYEFATHIDASGFTPKASHNPAQGRSRSERTLGKPDHLNRTLKAFHKTLWHRELRVRNIICRAIAGFDHVITNDFAEVPVNSRLRRALTN